MLQLVFMSPTSACVRFSCFVHLRDLEIVWTHSSSCEHQSGPMFRQAYNHASLQVPKDALLSAEKRSLNIRTQTSVPGW